MLNIQVTFQDNTNNRTTVTLPAEEGDNLFDLLRRAGLAPESSCGGRGSCGQCRVLLQEDTSVASEDASAIRELLACRTILTGNCRVTLPTVFRPEAASLPAIQSNYPSAESAAKDLSVALDLGSTTLALSLFSEDAEPIHLSAWNILIPYGADVLSRVRYSMDHPEGLQELSGLLRRQVNDLIASVTTQRPARMMIAGNTIMQHLFAGIDPSPIVKAPFIPSTLFQDRDNHCLPPFADTDLQFLPCITGYIGGDITAGLLACDLTSREKLTLFLDIGTNGEMVLGNRDSLLCTSVACGPAFEGAGIHCGMRSTSGAICHVAYRSSHLQAEVVGDTPAVGICGSGLVDLAACLLQQGVIDSTGLLLGPEEAPDLWSGLIAEDENENGIFLLSRAIPSMPSTNEIVLTAADVRELQLAKAAVRAGIELLLRRSGHSPADVEEVLIAGSFGSHLSPESMIAIGMLPPEFLGRIRAVGNTSLAGAELLLQESVPTHFAEKLRTITRSCRHLELAEDPDFASEYIRRMAFPG